MLEVIFSTGQSERLLPNREVLIQKHRAVVNIYLPSFCKQSKILINEMLLYMEGGGVMVLNSTFNNVSLISWQSILLVEKTTDKLYYSVSSGNQTRKYTNFTHS